MCDILLITGNVSHERECLEFPVKRVLEVDLSFCVQNKLKSKKCGSWLFLYSQAWQHTLQKPSYVVFVNYSTAYPSVHRDRLSSILLHNGIVGHMWHHLRARIDNIRLRVLHPNIQEHQTVDILRGLPEISRLSPTLFGIFVADLIHELRIKFPHAVINLAPGLQHNGKTQIWIGGSLYVDDLALMSTCPRELQAMLYICQEWSVRNRMGKTNVL